MITTRMLIEQPVSFRAWFDSYSNFMMLRTKGFSAAGQTDTPLQCFPNCFVSKMGMTAVHFPTTGTQPYISAVHILSSHTHKLIARYQNVCNFFITQTEN
jgi:hypothetical protein